ncbi:uncharacterized protein N7469_001938 [Penicillium citrinum]|uniref:Uncharacterized protein n=1 Tax=Penicillium citrinum TaxID=5077 RepID=A0A9W9P9L0_PENCI|nr:uncharacterized protein N7469_001938 [Penicillium citrinum]KAJ5240347.1 hypothetical protein N7469_001938 [Penicillium citrinum]
MEGNNGRHCTCSSQNPFCAQSARSPAQATHLDARCRVRMSGIPLARCHRFDHRPQVLLDLLVKTHRAIAEIGVKKVFLAWHHRPCVVAVRGGL